MKSPQKLLFIALFITLASNGQVPCIPTPTDPCIPTGPGLPIDSGLSLLIVAGAAYGYKKLKAKR